MRKLFYFFDMEYERITHNPDMPFRIILESIGFVGPHWHPDIEVLMMLRGSVTVTNNRGKFRLSPGDIMIINSDEMHSLVELSDNLMIVCQFDSSLLSSLSAGNREYLLPCENTVPDTVISAMRRDIAGIWTEKQKMKSGYKSFCMSRLYSLLGIIIRNIPSQSPSKEQSHDEFRQVRTKKIMDYLHTHYKEQISLKELANQLHISPNYLSHLIRKETGYSFQENLKFIRTGKAVDLLMKTDMKLLEISIEVGFSDPKYFNFAFKELFGLTPKRLKQKPDWENALLKHFQNDGLDPSIGNDLIEAYLE